jgi:hypothetical protein
MVGDAIGEPLVGAAQTHILACLGRVSKRIAAASD